MSIIDDLNWRYATKNFDPTQKLSAEQLDTALESLRLTPSSFGLQPWKFLAISNPEIKHDLVSACWNQAQVGQCSHLIVLCHPLSISKEDIAYYVKFIASERNAGLDSLKGYQDVMENALLSKNQDELKIWMKLQSYIALGQLMTACATLKIDTCPMEGFIADEVDKILKLAEQNLTSAVLCPLGFRAVDDKYATLKKIRYPAEQVIKFLE